MEEYLKDWWEACEYAAECIPLLPDVYALVPLIWIGGACATIWAFNEWRISRTR